MPPPSKPTEQALRPGPEQRAEIERHLQEEVRTSIAEVQRLLDAASEAAAQGEHQDAFSSICYARTRIRHAEYYISRLHSLDSDIRHNSL